MSLPSYGQRSDPRAAPDCPRHPGERSVDYCKRCNRPICVDCAVPTEVRSICVDCAASKRSWSGRASRAVATGAPVVTYALMAICVLMFAFTWVMPLAGSALTLVPARLATHPWTVLTSAFLHGGILHIGFNMLTLYWVGRAIEPALGWWRYLSVYLVSALGGSAFVVAWCLIQPSQIYAGTVGASGAVFGLFGAVFVLQRLHGSDTTSIVVLLAVNLGYGFIASGISWQAHIGGLLIGAASTWVLTRLSRPRPGVTEAAQTRRQVLAAVGMLAGLIALNALVFRALLLAYGT